MPVKESFLQFMKMHVKSTSIEQLKLYIGMSLLYREKKY